VGSLIILQQARDAGLEVRARGDRLIVRGPKRHAALARALLAHKAEVLNELAHDAPPPPPSAWPLEGLPLEQLFPDLRAGGEPPAACRCCGGRSWWRLVGRRGSTPWVCERCHPPQVEEDRIERVGGEEGQ